MRLIDADALMNTLQELFDKREKEQMFTGSIGAFVTWNDAIFHFKTAPTIDAVTREAFNRILWENDTMREQLASIGKPFGEKMDDVAKIVRCKDCRHKIKGELLCRMTCNNIRSDYWYCADGERGNDEHTD